MPTKFQKKDEYLLKESENINQARLIALNTMFEAARAGKAGASLALMAAKIKQWVQDSTAGPKKAGRPNRA